MSNSLGETPVTHQTGKTLEKRQKTDKSKHQTGTNAYSIVDGLGQTPGTYQTGTNAFN